MGDAQGPPLQRTPPRHTRTGAHSQDLSHPVRVQPYQSVKPCPFLYNPKVSIFLTSFSLLKPSPSLSLLSPHFTATTPPYRHLECQLPERRRLRSLPFCESR